MAKMHLYQYVFVYGDKGSWKKDIKKRLEMVDMHGQLT